MSIDSPWSDPRLRISSLQYTCLLQAVTLRVNCVLGLQQQTAGNKHFTEEGCWHRLIELIENKSEGSAFSDNKIFYYASCSQAKPQQALKQEWKQMWKRSVTKLSS